MRSYGQFCALAKALDVIGDRWSLLIVRELLLRDCCRYTDLRNGLPGIATNLLAERLRELERAGLIAREEAPPPIATAVFRLTTRGRDLDPIIHQLGQWGAPLLANAPKSDRFRTYWLGLAARNNLRDSAPARGRLQIEIRTGSDEPLAIDVENGIVSARPGASPDPDAVVTGPPAVVAAAIMGKMTLSEARAAGLHVEGDVSAVRRVLPSKR
jgi:DNA-binding HxlR family transcriptional regulator